MLSIRRKNKDLALVLIITLIISSFSYIIAFANNEYKITIENGIVTEEIVGNINGQIVQMTRTTKPNGITNVEVNSGKESYVKIGVLDYQALLKRIELEKTTPNMYLQRADTAHSSNCYHVLIAENEVTVTREEGATSAAAMAGILATYLTANPKIIYKVASLAYGAVRKSDIAYVEVSEKVNEVFFKSDDVYYTHCYHNTVKSYDAFDHLVKTTTQRNQAVGG